MTKEELEQYRSIVAEIDEIRDRLNDNTVHGTVTGSDSEFPYVKHSFSVGGVIDTERNKRDMILLRKLEVQKQTIDEFIANIPDSVTRRIFRYRYIEGQDKVTWLQVVKRMYPKLSLDKQYKMKENIRKKCTNFLKKR